MTGRNLLGTMDTENIENVEDVVLDLESYETAEYNNAEAVEAEQSIGQDLETIESAISVAGNIETAIVDLESQIDSMSAVSVGIALGGLRAAVSDLDAGAAKDARVDVESLEADIVRSTKMELNAIKDTVKKAWEAIKKFFKAIWAKIKKAFDSVLMWFADSTKKAEGYLKELSGLGELKDELNLEDVSKKLGSRIATVSSIEGNDYYKGYMTFSGKITKAINDQTKFTAAETEIDKFVTAGIKSGAARLFTGEVPALGANDSVKVSRIDGTKVRYAMLTTIDGVAGYTKYVKLSLSEIAIKSIKLSKVPSLDEIKTCLGTVKGNTAALKKLRDVLAKELVDIDKEVSSDIEALKPSEGFFKLQWAAVTGNKTVDQLTAEEKMTIVRNKSSFASAYASDAVFGGLGAVKEMVAVSKIFMDCYGAKK